MDEEEPHIAGGQDVQPSECQRKVLMRRQEPGADTSQSHLEPHKGGLSVIDHDGHERVSLATAILDEEQRAKRIEDRGPYYDEQEHGNAPGGAINMGFVFLSDPAEPLALPIESQGIPESCGMGATIIELTSVRKTAFSWIFHAMLPFSSLLPIRTVVHKYFSLKKEQFISSQKRHLMSTEE
jgi:hypothetical protein